MAWWDCPLEPWSEENLPMKKKPESTPKKKAAVKRTAPTKKKAATQRGPKVPAKKQTSAKNSVRPATSKKSAPSKTPSVTTVTISPDLESESTGKKLHDFLLDLISDIPGSKEHEHNHPKKRVQSIVRKAALKAASVSGGLALPGGVVAWIGILPDLMAVWRIQSQMVADIAAVYGKSGDLTRETMLYCLFKHGGAAAVRDIAARVGGKILVKPANLKVLQSVMKKLGYRLSQKVLKQGIARFVPAVGALAVGGYAYYDTVKVGATAMETFASDIEIEEA